jgi:regulator of protease activity HflC (stomatin/prohibitin superfamily)
MADEPLEPVPTAPPPEPITADAQLTQVRVPIADAADAFTMPDAYGRLPIVVLTGERSRIRNDFVVGGAVAIVLGAIFEFSFALRGGLVIVGGVLLVLGVIQSVLVRIPEGAQAITIRSGKFDKILPPGVHFVPPWIGITHVVTKREIPFLAPIAQVATADGVRVDIDMLITLVIEAAERFVYAISAPDFDIVCRAASQDALRRLVRSVSSQDVLDLAGSESDTLRSSIGKDLDAYGAVVHKVALTAVRPPTDYMASLEARRLAEVQQEEQAQLHALERRRQADRIDLERTEAEEQRKMIEIEAANESLRLERLQARIGAFPQAAQWDVESQRLDVARALAGNERTLLALGGGSGPSLTEALLMAGRPDDDASDQPAPKPVPASKPSRTRRASSS